MTSIEAKTKLNEIAKFLSELEDGYILNEVRYHKLLMDLKSLKIKSPDITEFEMMIHYYGNNHQALVSSAKRLIKESNYNLKYSYNICSVLTAFFEIDEVLDYLDHIDLHEIDSNSSDKLVEELTSTAILFYFINGSISDVSGKFEKFFKDDLCTRQK